MAREGLDRRLVILLALLALGLGVGVVAFIAHLRTRDRSPARGPGGEEASASWLARRIRGYDAVAFEDLMKALTAEPVRALVLSEISKDERLVRSWERHQREQGRDLSAFVRKVQDQPEGQLLLERLASDPKLAEELRRADSGDGASRPSDAGPASSGGSARPFRSAGSASALPPAFHRLSAQQQAFLARRLQDGANLWDACRTGGFIAGCAESWKACQAEAGCSAWAQEQGLDRSATRTATGGGPAAHNVVSLGAVKADYQDKDARANMPSWFNELTGATKQTLYSTFEEKCINGSPPQCDPGALCAAAGACAECEQAAQLGGQPFSCPVGSATGTSTGTETDTGTGTGSGTDTNTGSATSTIPPLPTDTNTGTTTGTGTRTRTATECNPGANCLDLHEIIVKERCPGPQRIYRARGNCCSCKISCYNAGSNHSSYNNTGAACRSSRCDSGRYQIHYCTD